MNTPNSNNTINTNQDLLVDSQSQLQPHPPPVHQTAHPQPRRPRGFAATAAAAAASSPDSAITPGGNASGGKGKREREKEKERTKLRERHRRAITSRMLAGLRQYGNFPLPARADMNDVLAALAREAGWTVEPDGTTYRQSPPPSQMASFGVRPVEGQLSSGSMKSCQASVLRIDESLSPASLDSVVMTERDSKSDKYAGGSPINSVECLDADQLIQDVRSSEQENHFNGTPYIPVYVALANGYINNFCQLIDPHGLREELSYLKSLNVDGITVDCWWGIVEAWSPQKYVWSGYRELFNIVREFKLKLQVYFDFMRSFRSEFDDLFSEELISAIEIGLGASGELKYPSFSERMGWRYPGIGEFQCYDKYLQQSLCTAAKMRGHSFWARGPDNAGHYNSRPHETGFFCERGDYDSYYGRFFLQWYSQSLIDHADNVLSLARFAFDDTRIVVKIPAVYWWYKTSSHAAELTAGFYNSTNQDGYSPVFNILKEHSVTMKFVCNGLQILGHENNEALADPEGLSWQVLNSAWDRGLTVAGVNVLSCFDREGYMRVVDAAKPKNDPDHHHFSFFVYQQPSPLIQGTICFPELDYFIKYIHGEISGNLVP